MNIFADPKVQKAKEDLKSAYHNASQTAKEGAQRGKRWLEGIPTPTLKTVCVCTTVAGIFFPLAWIAAGVVGYELVKRS